jgi:hypothetical protein
MKGYIFQHLCAPNDRNGNPRRLWVLYSKGTGDVFEVINEGYGGRPTVCDARRVKTATEVAQIQISTKEYNNWCREAKRLGIYYTQ